MRKLVLLFVLLSFSAMAQERLEIIPLKNRLAEQVLPVLRPLLSPGGSISAMDNKLIVRSSAASLAQIRQVLASIDTPARRLMISVRQGSLSEQERRGVGVDRGAVAIRNGEINATIRGGAVSESATNRSNASQQVQTLEGGEASIFLGTSLPMPFQQVVSGPNGVVVTQGVEYVDVGSGFSARPQVNGEQITVAISPLMQRALGNQAGRGIESSRLSTQISGRLGEWIRLGGGSVESQQQGSGLLHYSTNGNQRSGEVWLKVDALD